jgi:hypothetical protein
MFRGIIRVLLGGKHHRHVHIAGEMSQPLGMARVGKSCEMQCVLVGRGGHDGIDVAALRQLDRGFDRVPGDAAGPDGPVSVGGSIAAAQTPGADRDPLLCLHRGDLVFRPYDRDVGLERLDQGGSSNLRTDAARVSEGYR